MDGNELMDFFGEVSTYRDEQAVEDGVLVEIPGSLHRVSRNAWNYIERKIGEEPPKFWPVNLFAFCRATTGAERAMAACGGLLDTSAGLATRTYESGGIYSFYTILDLDGDGTIARLTTQEPTPALAGGSEHFWIMPNELGGVALMLPSDY